jgi:hypothetical protein
VIVHKSNFSKHCKVNACFVFIFSQLLNATYGVLNKGMGASQVVFEHMASQPKHNGKGFMVKDNVKGYVEFRDVCFAYPSRPQQAALKVRHYYK